MAAVIYNVTINVEHDVHNEWFTWMKNVHIPDVMATGFFLEHRFCKVLVDEESGVTYSIQYKCANMADYEEYQKLHAPRLQKDTRDKFEGKFVAFRTLLEEV